MRNSHGTETERVKMTRMLNIADLGVYSKYFRPVRFLFKGSLYTCCADVVGLESLRKPLCVSCGRFWAGSPAIRPVNFSFWNGQEKEKGP